MGKEDEVNLLKDLDVERDRCDALQDKIKLLETELGDLNEEHEVLVQERQVCTLCVCVCGWVCEHRSRVADLHHQRCGARRKCRRLLLV